MWTYFKKFRLKYKSRFGGKNKNIAGKSQYIYSLKIMSPKINFNRGGNNFVDEMVK